MPSVSAKQHRFMEGIAHGMKPKSGKGPSKAVAQEFVQADIGHAFVNKTRANNNKTKPHG